MSVFSPLARGDVLLLLPILTPLLTAILLIPWVGRRGGNIGWIRAISVGGMLLQIVAAGLLLSAVLTRGRIGTQVGGWPAPYGITFFADTLSALLVLIAAIVGLAGVLQAATEGDAARERFGLHPLLHVLVMGVCGAFLTGDLFNLYVWFEVLLMASFVLLTLGGERAQMEGGIKYVTLNLIASLVFLVAVGLLYGSVGTLNLADLAVRAPAVDSSRLLPTLAMLFLVAFGVKAALFPFFFWLPASYHTPPISVSAVFAALLTKVGVYALLRVFPLLFIGDRDWIFGWILLLSVATMLIGGLGAVAQNEVRRILSFLIISHVGIAVAGLGLGTRDGIFGAIYYVAADMLTLCALFLVAGRIRAVCGSLDLARLGGLYRKRPAVALLFLLPALSLAGIPPLPGFWGKLLLLRAAIEQGQWGVVAALVAASLLTLFSVTKIWGEACWRPGPAAAAVGGIREKIGFIPVGMLVALLLAAGLFPEPGLRLARRAATQIVDRDGYIRFVLPAPKSTGEKVPGL